MPRNGHELFIDEFNIYLRPNIINGGKRGQTRNFLSGLANKFMVILHYPNQLFGHFGTGKNRWPPRKSNAPTYYMMAFDIRSVDVVEKKGTRHTPCIDEAVDFDREEQKMTLEGLECKPPYWNSSSLLPLCSTQEELRAVASGFLSKLLK